MNRRYFLIVLFVPAIFAGCAINTVPAPDSYTINILCATDKPLQKAARLTKVLKVSMPNSATAIMSRHILYQDDEFTQNPYAYSKWSDTPNKMLGSLFLSCINKHAIFKVVLPSYSKGKADFLLESTLSEFYHHINTDGSSEARVRIEFFLIAPKHGNVIATKEFSSTVSAKTLDATGGVRALSEASGVVALNLARWLSSLDDLIIN